MIGLISFIVLLVLTCLSIGYIYEVGGVKNLNIWRGESFGPLVRCLAEFTIGICAFSMHLFASANNSKYTKILYKNITSVIIGATLFLSLCLPNADLITVFLLPYFIIFLAKDTSFIAKLLSWNLIYFLGTISHSLYLYHFMTFWIKPNFISYIMNDLGLPHPYRWPLLCR